MTVLVLHGLIAVRDAHLIVGTAVGLVGGNLKSFLDSLSLHPSSIHCCRHPHLEWPSLLLQPDSTHERLPTQELTHRQAFFVHSCNRGGHTGPSLDRTRSRVAKGEAVGRAALRLDLLVPVSR